MSQLKPTNDFLFKKIFGQEKNKDLLIDLLESILPNLKIKTIEINKDVTLEKDILTSKLGVLDILAVLNNDTRVNIEVQVTDYHNTIERSLFYETGVFHGGLETGEMYQDVSNSISIWIMNYNIFDDGPFHETAHLTRDFNKEILTNKLELHYIQLPKFKEKCKKISSKLDEWLTFIVNENMEAIRMCENEKVKKAEEEFEYLTGDEAERRLAYLREKAIRDNAWAASSMHKKGLEEGIEQGKKEGIEQGKKEGIEQGKKEGKKEEKKQIAKKMLEMDMSIDEICEVTGLTVEEIENL